MFVFEIFGGELEIIPSDIIDLTGFTDMTYTSCWRRSAPACPSAA